MILKVYQRSLHFKAMKKIIARVCLFVFFFYEGMSLRNIPLPQKKKKQKRQKQKHQNLGKPFNIQNFGFL